MQISLPLPTFNSIVHSIAEAFRFDQFGNIFSTAILVLSGLALTLTAQASSPSNPCKRVPKSLQGTTLVLQVENLVSDTPDIYPSKGVIVQKYQNRTALTAENFGTLASGIQNLKYRYKRLGKTKAVEIVIEPTTGKTFTTHYEFNTPNHGTWVRTVADEPTKSTGHFMLSTGSDTANLAPTGLSGLTVVLSVIAAHSETLPADSYPVPGSAILQSYHLDGSYFGRGFGLGTIDHEGSYSATLAAPNILVEQTMQTIPSLGFTAPYTMVYSFDTPYSGIWYQNFANGLITFSGHFTTFETQ